MNKDTFHHPQTDDKDFEFITKRINLINPY